MAIIKAVVLGDTECGKTSFTKRYTTGNFPDPDFLRSTIGASFDTRKVNLDSGSSATLSIWDFGGQTRFIEQLKQMIRGTVVGLLFFDVVKLQTLDHLESYWIPMIEENSDLKISNGDGDRFIIVGNKIDLIGSERIDQLAEELVYFFEKYEMNCHLISAKTGVGLEGLDKHFLQKVDKYLPQ